MNLRCFPSAKIQNNDQNLAQNLRGRAEPQYCEEYANSVNGIIRSLGRRACYPFSV